MMENLRSYLQSRLGITASDMEPRHEVLADRANTLALRGRYAQAAAVVNTVALFPRSEDFIFHGVPRRIGCAEVEEAIEGFYLSQAFSRALEDELVFRRGETEVTVALTYRVETTGNILVTVTPR